jgi:hypothetical protein
MDKPAGQQAAKRWRYARAKVSNLNVISLLLCTRSMAIGIFLSEKIKTLKWDGELETFDNF